MDQPELFWDAEPWATLGPRLGDALELPSETRLFEQGQRIKAVYVLASGIVKILRDRDGRMVVSAFRSPPRLLGVMSAVLGDLHLATAVTLTACVIHPLTAPDFHSTRLNDNRFGEWMQRALASEAYSQMERVTAVSAAGVRQRLERTLADLAVVFGHVLAEGSIRIDLPISVTALADLALSARAPGSRLLSKLEREGQFIRKKGWFEIPPGSRLMADIRRRRGGV